MRKSAALLTLFLALITSSRAFTANTSSGVSIPIASASQPLQSPDQCRFWCGEWYFSWGYSKDYWTNSNLHVVQNALHNDFMIYNVSASDGTHWTQDFANSFSNQQYNLRIGRFVGVKRQWAVELSFDHTKYNTNLNQVAYIDGSVNGQPAGYDRVLSSDYFYYALHNGANHLMVNAVRRIPVLGATNATGSLAALAKFGMGVLLPHPESTIFNNAGDVGPKAWPNYFGWDHGWWQFGGWTLGVEAGLRFVIYKPIYLEITDKEAFTSLHRIQVYEGHIDQNVLLSEIILSLGVTFNG